MGDNCRWSSPDKRGDFINGQYVPRHAEEQQANISHFQMGNEITNTQVRDGLSPIASNGLTTQQFSSNIGMTTPLFTNLHFPSNNGLVTPPSLTRKEHNQQSLIINSQSKFPPINLNTSPSAVIPFSSCQEYSYFPPSSHTNISETFKTPHKMEHLSSLSHFDQKKKCEVSPFLNRHNMNLNSQCLYSNQRKLPKLMLSPKTQTDTSMNPGIFTQSHLTESLNRMTINDNNNVGASHLLQTFPNWSNGANPDYSTSKFSYEQFNNTKQGGFPRPSLNSSPNFINNSHAGVFSSQPFNYCQMCHAYYRPCENDCVMVHCKCVPCETQRPPDVKSMLPNRFRNNKHIPQNYGSSNIHQNGHHNTNKKVPFYNDPRKKCKKHPTNFIRFRNKSIPDYCVVCQLKYIQQKNEPIPTLGVTDLDIKSFPNLDCSEYLRAVNRLKEIIIRLAVLIKRSLKGKLDFYSFSPVDKHYYFSSAVVDSLTDQLRSETTHFMKVIEATNSTIENISNIDTGNELVETLHILKDVEDTIAYLLQMVESKGPQRISSVSLHEDRARGRQSFVDGPALCGTVELNSRTYMSIYLRDEANQPVKSIKREMYKIRITECGNGLCGNVLMIIGEDTINKGAILVTFTITNRGKYKFSATVNDEEINGASFNFECMETKDYYSKSIYEPTYIVGEQQNHGSLDSPNSGKRGIFDKPWGIYINEDKYTFVCDRAATPIIHVYNPSMLKYHEISKNSLFNLNRPSKAIPLGPCTESPNVLICDKDASRMYRVTWGGDVVECTDKNNTILDQESNSVIHQGADPMNGLNFPWDFCIDRDNRVLVTDSRNHRIAIYDLNLNYIGMITFKNSIQPRGICMGIANHIIVTGFNVQEVAIIAIEQSGYPLIKDIDTYHGADERHWYCTEGMVVKVHDLKSKREVHEKKGEKTLDRLQGLTLDKYFNIVVADSRQEAIRIITYYGGDEVTKLFQNLTKDFTPMDVSCLGDVISVTNLKRGTVDIYDLKQSS